MRSPCAIIIQLHNSDVTMDAMASQITILTTVYSTVYSVEDQRKHQSSASLALVLGFHRRPVNSPHKGPVPWKMFPFDDVIMHIKFSNCKHHIRLCCFDEIFAFWLNSTRVHCWGSNWYISLATCDSLPSDIQKAFARTSDDSIHWDTFIFVIRPQ